jgi:hypothetical protein
VRVAAFADRKLTGRKLRRLTVAMLACCSRASFIAAKLSIQEQFHSTFSKQLLILGD